MQNQPLVFVLLLALFMTMFLSACGSKGDLYQTPEPEVTKNEQVSVAKNNEPSVHTPKKK